MGRLPARMASRPLTKLSSLLMCVAALTVLAACGGSHTKLSHEDNTGAGGINSSYLTLGQLQYQVQISRTLNPSITEDRGYLSGLPAAQQQLTPGNLWFGVFLLVLNNSNKAQPTASSFSLSDTQNHVYLPLTLPASNAYAYRPQTLAPSSQIPAPESTAATGPTQAALLLFHLPTTAYDNRPLILTIVNPDNPAQRDTVTLDV